MVRAALTILCLSILAAPLAAQDEPPDWRLWWEDHRDELDPPKIIIKRMRVTVSTRSSGFSTGPGCERSTEQKRIDAELVPALHRVARDHRMPVPVRSAAIVALSRASYADSILPLLDSSRSGGSEFHEAAVLARGIWQRKSPEIRDALIAVADDRESTVLARCWAMLSLGLLMDNDKSVYACLDRRLSEPGAGSELHACALLTYGLIGDAAVAPRLMDWYRSGVAGSVPIDERLACQVLRALGMIGDPRAVPLMLGALETGTPPVRRAAALALGNTVPQGDETTQLRSVRRLADARSEPGLTACHLLALGWIGTQCDATAEVRLVCLDTLRQPYAVSLRPHRTLALGLLGDELAWRERKPEEFRTEVLTAIRAEGPCVASARALRQVGQTWPCTGEIKERRRALVGLLRDLPVGDPRIGPAIHELARIGDAHEAPVLIEILEPGSAAGRYGIVTRALATWALGKIADQRDVPVLQQLSRHIDRGTAPKAILEALRHR